MPFGTADSHVPISQSVILTLKQADIIISALGVPNFVKEDMVKDGAVIVDVGITRVADNSAKGYKIVGDVDYEDCLDKCSKITPVPGGVGPMTIACLLLNTLLASYAQFNEKCAGEITPNEILVTAPYNVQVNKLEQRLEGKARVGTVDRFQGQEAPIAIHSLTASSGDDAPRGIDFLLEPNRLNVAISRAQCLSIVIGCPRLVTGLINTVDEAEQVNRLCRLMMNN